MFYMKIEACGPANERHTLHDFRAYLCARCSDKSAKMAEFWAGSADGLSIELARVSARPCRLGLWKRDNLILTQLFHDQFG